MRFLEIAKKDLGIFLRKKINALIFFLSPFVIILLIGSSLSLPTLNNIPVVLCAPEGSSTILTITQEVESASYFKIKRLGGDCKAEATVDVKEGKAKAAVIVPPDLSYDSEIELIVDNSNFYASQSIQAGITGAVYQASSRVFMKSVQEMYDTLLSIYNETEALNAAISTSQVQIQSVVSEADNLDRMIDTTKLSDAQLKIQQSLDDFRALQTKIDAISLKDVNSTVFFIDSTNSNFLSTDCTSTTTACVNANLTVALTQQAMNDLTAIQANLDDIKSDNQLSYSKLNASILEFDRIVKSDVLPTKEKASLLKRHINSLVGDFQTTGDVLRKKINETNAKIEELRAIGTRPTFSVFAIRTTQTFPNIRFIDYFALDFLIMIVVFAAVLFASLSVFHEKSSGTLLRIFSSPTSSIEFILGKILYLLVIAGIEFLIGSAVLYFILNVSLKFNFDSLALLFLGIISFIEIGMLVSFVADSEKTALVVSSTLIVLFIFLAGTFTPIETYPAAIAGLAQLLPTTLTIKGMKNIMLYATTAEAEKELLLYYVGGLFALLIAVFFLETEKLIKGRN